LILASSKRLAFPRVLREAASTQAIHSAQPILKHDNTVILECVELLNVVCACEELCANIESAIDGRSEERLVECDQGR